MTISIHPFQYSCLGNPIDKWDWRASVHGDARVGHSLVTKPYHSKHNKPSTCYSLSKTKSLTLFQTDNGNKPRAYYMSTHTYLLSILTTIPWGSNIIISLLHKETCHRFKDLMDVTQSVEVQDPNVYSLSVLFILLLPSDWNMFFSIELFLLASTSTSEIHVVWKAPQVFSYKMHLSTWPICFLPSILIRSVIERGKNKDLKYFFLYIKNMSVAQ